MRHGVKDNVILVNYSFKCIRVALVIAVCVNPCERLIFTRRGADLCADAVKHFAQNLADSSEADYETFTPAQRRCRFV